MLTDLTISNVVLIDRLDLKWEPGFSALTGETGAGKSILLDSLTLATGARSDSSLIRKNTEQATVTAVFSLAASHPVYALLAEQGFDVAAGEDVLLRRQITQDGRSKAFINDQPVSVSLLKQVGELLLEFHGQFATHALLQQSAHREVLDRFADAETTAKQVQTAWNNYRTAEDTLRNLQRDAQLLVKETEFLQNAVSELDNFAPQAGEEDTLAERRQVLRNQASLLETLANALEAVGGENGARQSLLTAWRGLGRMADKGGQTWDDAIQKADTVLADLQDFEAQVEDLRDELLKGDGNLDQVEERLFAYRSFARKYDCQPDDLEVKLAEFQEQLATVNSLDARLANAANEVDVTRNAYLAATASLTKLRSEATGRLEKLVSAELPALKLEKTRFVVDLKPLPEEQWGPSGVEDIRFLVATHGGAEPAPMQKVVSGGELSRLMLALKLVLVDAAPAVTLVFDEVDTGIGGATSAAVGERLAKLAQKRQVMIVTHAPQVAAKAAAHLVVSKAENQSGAMTTSINRLQTADERREEIARMLSGEQITTEARAAAAALLEPQAA